MLVDGQAINFGGSCDQARVPSLAREAPFTSNDIDFCGDQQMRARLRPNAWGNTTGRHVRRRDPEQRDRDLR